MQDVNDLAQVYLKRVEVPSFSNPEKTYIVTQKEDGTWQCSCPVWIYRRRTCKHIEAVKEAEYRGIDLTKQDGS